MEIMKIFLLLFFFSKQRDLTVFTRSVRVNKTQSGRGNVVVLGLKSFACAKPQELLHKKK